MVEVPTRKLSEYLDSLPNGGNSGLITKDLTVRNDVVGTDQAVPAGGLEGYVLAKQSGADFDVEWTPAGNGDMLESVYDPQLIEADAFARANHTGTQPASTITGLASVATTGQYNDLLNKPSLGTAAFQNSTVFATAAQGAKADTAMQPSVYDPQGKNADAFDRANFTGPNIPDDGSVTNAKVVAYASGTAPDAGKIAYRPTWTGSFPRPLTARFSRQIHISEADPAGDGVTNDATKIQAIVDYVASTNEQLTFDARNYKLNVPVNLTNFTSMKLKGAGTGDATVASGAGTCFVTNGIYDAFTVSMTAFPQENVIFEGITLYNALIASNPTLAQTGGGVGIRWTKGAATGRYPKGIVLRDVGINGFSAALFWEALGNTSATDNYFGKTILDNVTAYQTGQFWIQKNSASNDMTWRDVFVHANPYGGIECLPDGFGAMVECNGTNIRMEGVGGILQLGKGMAGVRSKISWTNFKRESCGARGTPGTGDPFGLTAYNSVSAPNAGADIMLSGNIDYGIPFGESARPSIPTGSTLLSTSDIQVTNTGGRLLSQNRINAPSFSYLLTASGSPGATKVITLKCDPAYNDFDFTIKSQIALADGVYGYQETLHTGRPSGSTVNTDIVTYVTGAVTVSFGSGAADELLVITLTNTSGFGAPVKVDIINISGANIITASEF